MTSKPSKRTTVTGRRASVREDIDAVGMGPAQMYVEILSHGVWFADGVELTMLTALTAAIGKDFDLTGVQMASLTSIAFVGITVGSILSGYLGDNIGRRYTIICSYATVVITCAFSTLAWSFYILLLVRLLEGIGMGIGMPTSLAMVNEMSPSSWKIPMMGMRGVVFSIGNIWACFVILLDDPTLLALSWRVNVLIAIVPSFILGVSAIFVLPESALFLETRGRHDDAEKVLAWIRHHNGASQIDEDDEDCKGSPDIETLPTLSSTSASPEPRSWGTQIRKVFGRHLAFGTCVLMMCTCSINFVEYGSGYAEPRVLPETHATLLPGWQLLCKYSLNLVVRCGVIFPAAFSSRKVALASALCACGIGAVLFAWTGVMLDRSPLLGMLYYVGQYLPLIGVSLGFLLCYQLSVEIYPAWAAATGSAFIVGGGRVASMLVPYLFEAMKAAWQNFYYTMAMSCLASTFCVLCLNVEELSAAAEDDFEDPTRALTDAGSQPAASSALQKAGSSK